MGKYENEHQLTTPNSKRALERMRAICLKLPETEEKIDGFGHTAFQVRGKSFVLMGENHEDGTCNVSLKASKTTQEILLQQEGTAFFKTPYIGQHGWVSVRAEEATPWEEVASVALEGYCLAAPKRLAAQVQSSAR